MKAGVLFNAALCIFGAGIALAAPAPGLEAEIPPSLLQPAEEGPNVYQKENQYTYKPTTPAGRHLLKIVTTATDRLDKLYYAMIPSDLIKMDDPAYDKLTKRRERDIKQFETVSRDLFQVFKNQKHILDNPQAYGPQLSKEELADRRGIAAYLEAYYDLAPDQSIHGQTLYGSVLNQDLADVEYAQQACDNFANANQRERRNLIRMERGLANPGAFLEGAELKAKIAENEVWLRGGRGEQGVATTRAEDRRLAMKKLDQIVQWHKELRIVDQILLNSMQNIDLEINDDDFEDYKSDSHISEDDSDLASSTNNLQPPQQNKGAPEPERPYVAGQDDDQDFGDNIKHLYPKAQRPYIPGSDDVEDFPLEIKHLYPKEQGSYVAGQDEVQDFGSGIKHLYPKKQGSYVAGEDEVQDFAADINHLYPQEQRPYVAGEDDVQDFAGDINHIYPKNPSLYVAGEDDVQDFAADINHLYPQEQRPYVAGEDDVQDFGNAIEHLYPKGQRPYVAGEDKVPDFPADINHVYPKGPSPYVAGEDETLDFGDGIDGLYPDGEVKPRERSGNEYKYQPLNDEDSLNPDEHDPFNEEDSQSDDSGYSSDSDSDEEGDPAGFPEGPKAPRRYPAGFFNRRFQGRPAPEQPQPANDNVAEDRETREPEPQPNDNHNMRDSGIPSPMRDSTVPIGHTMSPAARLGFGRDSANHPAGLVTSKYPNKYNYGPYEAPPIAPLDLPDFTKYAPGPGIDLTNSQSIPRRKAATTDDIPTKKKVPDFDIDALLKDTEPSRSLADLQSAVDALDRKEEPPVDLNDLAQLARDIKVPEEVQPAEYENDDFGDLEDLYKKNDQYNHADDYNTAEAPNYLQPFHKVPNQAPNANAANDEYPPDFHSLTEESEHSEDNDDDDEYPPDFEALQEEEPPRNPREEPAFDFGDDFINMVQVGMNLDQAQNSNTGYQDAVSESNNDWHMRVLAPQGIDIKLGADSRVEQTGEPNRIRIVSTVSATIFEIQLGPNSRIVQQQEQQPVSPPAEEQPSLNEIDFGQDEQREEPELETSIPEIIDAQSEGDTDDDRDSEEQREPRKEPELDTSIPEIIDIQSEGDAEDSQDSDEVVFADRKVVSEPVLEAPHVVPPRRVNLQVNSKGQLVNMNFLGPDQGKWKTYNDLVQQVDGTWPKPASVPASMNDLSTDKDAEKPAEQKGRRGSVGEWLKGKFGFGNS